DRARHRMRNPGGEHGCSPAVSPVAGQLEVETLAGETGGNAADAGPAREPLAEGSEQSGLRTRNIAEVEGGQHREEGTAALAQVVGCHWMISSARRRTDGGIVRPSALAVFRLMTSSNLVGCSTGKSAGFAPFKILST